MKQEIDPKMAVGVIAAIVVVAGVAVWAGTAAQKQSKDPPGMPPAVAEEFSKRMQGAGVSATGPGGQGSGPGGTARFIAPPGPPGGAPR